MSNVWGFRDVVPERAANLQPLGFTERQARFLVTVMLHSGVFLERQYCRFAGITHGQKTRDFFSTLVARKLATAYSAAHRRARIFHIHSKRLYTVISEPNNRNRKPITLGRAIERLMILDAVIAEPRMRWLGSEKEKVEYFRQATSLRVGELPSISFGQPPKQTVRHFPDKLPIGVTGHGRTHVFLYLIDREAPVDFRPSSIDMPSCCARFRSGRSGCWLLNTCVSPCQRSNPRHVRRWRCRCA